MGQSQTDELAIYIKQINDYSEVLWERLKMDYVLNRALQDAGIAGDGIVYMPWDSEITTGQNVKKSCVCGHWVHWVQHLLIAYCI